MFHKILYNTFLAFILTFLVNCNQPDPQTSQSIKLNSTIKISPRDTCLRILRKMKFSNVSKTDTLEYLRFYGKMRSSLSFVKIGEFISPDLKSGVLIYTPNDTTISVELYTLNMSGWSLASQKVNLKTSWLMFYPVFADYNFDGINDIYININVSNGNSLSSGYLFTIGPHNTLISHPETETIRDMTPDNKTRSVKGRKYLGCFNYDTVYDETYKWKENKLILISKPLECKE
jgi:hypothetical protein